MSLTFKIKNLAGDCQLFDNLDPNHKIIDLKKFIIKNHNSINNLFSPNLLKISNILLYQSSKKLENNILLSELQNNDFITFSIISESINIDNENKTLFNNYKISPCSILDSYSPKDDSIVDEDIFMDSFEDEHINEKTNKDSNEISNSKIIGEIKLYLSEMNKLQCLINDKIIELETRLNP